MVWFFGQLYLDYMPYGCSAAFMRMSSNDFAATLKLNLMHGWRKIMFNFVSIMLFIKSAKEDIQKAKIIFTWFVDYRSSTRKKLHSNNLLILLFSSLIRSKVHHSAHKEVFCAQPYIYFICRDCMLVSPSLNLQSSYFIVKYTMSSRI